MNPEAIAKQLDEAITFSPLSITTECGYENVSVCDLCGAIVWWSEVHKQWHLAELLRGKP